MSGISVPDLVIEFIDMVGIDTSIQNEWTINNNEKIMRYLNRSYWEILNEYDFPSTKSITTIVVNAGTNVGQIPPISGGNPTNIDAIVGISYVDAITYQSVKLIKMTIDDFQIMAQGQPSLLGPPVYYMHELPNFIYVLPIVDQTYTLTLWNRIQLDDLVQSGTGTTDGIANIPREWHELVLFGAVHRALLSVRDYEGAAFIKNMQTSMTNDKVSVAAKENVDNRFSGLSYGKGSAGGTDNNRFNSRTGYYGRGLWR